MRKFFSIIAQIRLIYFQNFGSMAEGRRQLQNEFRRVGGIRHRRKKVVNMCVPVRLSRGTKDRQTSISRRSEDMDVPRLPVILTACGQNSMFSGCSHAMWADSQLLWVQGTVHSQQMWAENCAVIGQDDLCYRAVTNREIQRLK
jgi:hypothetical protein